MFENLLPGRPVFAFLVYPNAADIRSIIASLGHSRFVTRELAGKVWVCV